jgi:hypothetical protein
MSQYRPGDRNDPLNAKIEDKNNFGGRAAYTGNAIFVDTIFAR